MSAPDPSAAPVEVPDFSGLCLSLEQWRRREIPRRDHLLGNVYTTTTRALLSADTGLGKTHLGFAIGMAIAAGGRSEGWPL